MPSFYIAGNERPFAGGVGLTGYTGPGDINPGAFGWWGLRAYSAANIGTKAINLFRDSDSAESDFNTIVGGGLDLAAIAAFKTGAGAANLFLITLYDQTGGGNDMGFSGGFLPFTLNALNGTLPTFGPGSSPVANARMTGSPASPNDPITSSFVYMVGSAASGNGQSIFLPGNNRFASIGGPGGTAANEIAIFDGGASLTGTAADATWHAVNAFYNGTGVGSLTIDLQPPVTGVMNANSTVDTFQFGNIDMTTWQATEGGVWAGSITSVIANQKAFYGI